jgi:hypothetical protein
MMKLYVVGESTPDPEKWSMWSEYALVIASSEEEARKLAGKDAVVQEIPMDKPLFLVGMTAPNWGEDT